MTRAGVPTYNYKIDMHFGLPSYTRMYTICAYVHELYKAVCTYYCCASLHLIAYS